MLKISIIVTTIFLLQNLFAQDLSKCNIDTFGDPNNKPECYMDFPSLLQAGFTFSGWPVGTKLYAAPKEKNKMLHELVKSNHWMDEELELTGKFKGDWAEVKLTKFNKKLASCDEARKVKWHKKGWIKVKDAKNKILVWKWKYTGLC